MNLEDIKYDIDDSGFGDGSVAIQFSEIFANEGEAQRFLLKFKMQMQTTEEVYFSYRDINSEIQHASMKTKDVGEYIGTLETKLNKFKALVKEFNEINKTHNDS